MDTAIYKPRNEGIEIRLRRYRDALALSGGMVIALSVWDIIKLYISAFLGEDTIAQFIESAVNLNAGVLLGTEYEKTTNIFLWVAILSMLLVFSAVILLYHLYIGLNAFREGRQTAKKQNRFYLVLTAFSAAFTAFLIVSNVSNSVTAADSDGSIGVAYFLMEATSLANYISILYTAAKIRKLEMSGGRKP